MTEPPVRDHFLSQAASCRSLGSAFTAELLTLCAERLRPGRPVTDRLFGWGDVPRMYLDAVALRLAGGLHALVLSGTDPALAAVYPPHDAQQEKLWQAVDAAIDAHADHLLHWLDSPPQTNEVRRCAALVAAACEIASGCPDRPMRLSELGASAGLNLFWDSYTLCLPDGTRRGPDNAAVALSPDWTGPLPAATLPAITDRRGVDLNPLNPDNADHRLRLLSYIWADQTDRANRTTAALDLARPVVDAGDAGGWLSARLADGFDGIDLIYHTIAWQYFPEETRAACRATPESPVAWLRVEADEDSPGAGILLTLWPQGMTHRLGRMDFHGRWVQWTGLSEA